MQRMPKKGGLKTVEAKIATVSQVNGYLKRILDSNEILNNIWIKGEISNFKLHYSGHMYITLKDEGGVLKAVMFKSSALKLNFNPSDGMKVLARGRISVYEAGGSYQLYIEEMIPDGVGALYLAYEQLKNKLSAEGLFNEEHKKPIPRFPEKIGVVTAATGAAVRDIINVITRRFPYAEIILYPTLVQGAGAASEIAEAIKYFNEKSEVDTLIVGRGGGSIEDLWAFNEEIVARAIFESKIPVISAVGHETDFTIADFVADLRAPTPSAAAEIAVPSVAEIYAGLSSYLTRILQAENNLIERKRFELKNLKLKNPKDYINERSMILDSYVKRIENSLNFKLLEGKKNFGELCAKLEALSPLSVMARGYSVAEDGNGNIIKSIKELNKDLEFDLRLYDGKKKCRVIQD